MIWFRGQGLFPPTPTQQGQVRGLRFRVAVRGLGVWGLGV